MPILYDLQEVAPLLGGSWEQVPDRLEDQKLDTSHALKEASVMAVALCEGERIEEPRQATAFGEESTPHDMLAKARADRVLADPKRRND